jgi:hypothetical protein
MDKLIKYQELIKQLLTDHLALISRRSTPDLDAEVLFDDEHGQYMLAKTGWMAHQRVRGATLYVRLRDGKFWIEEDWTEDGIVPELLKAGVPKEDIVLAFHHPDLRPLAEFANA